MNSIGLDKKKTIILVEKLNNLLADYMMFYQNARGLHWNIKGNKFFELHLKFEELYTNLLIKVDEIAERILTLGGNPLHTFQDYIKTAKVKPVRDISEAEKAVKSIITAFETLIVKQRELLDLSAKADDEGTNSLMSDYIREQEKLVWMYTAYLK